MLYRLAATKTEMVVVVASRVHHPASVPKRGTPATPVRMGIISVENEPAALHLCVTKLGAPRAGHFTLAEGQVHMFGGISVLIIDSKLADALRKASGRKCI